MAKYVWQYDPKDTSYHLTVNFHVVTVKEACNGFEAIATSRKDWSQIRETFQADSLVDSTVRVEEWLETLLNNKQI